MITLRKHNPELFPLDATTSDNIYGRVIHNKPEKKRPAKRIFRTTAPYIEHHELSKMLNMLNVEPHIENFEKKLRHVEQSKYQSLVGAHEVMKNRYMGADKLTPVTSAYILSAGIDPMHKFGITGGNRYNKYIRLNLDTGVPYTLNDVHEKVINRLRKVNADLDEFRKANHAFEEVQELMFRGADDGDDDGATVKNDDDVAFTGGILFA